MTEEELIAEYRERYNKACHGMMCGVGLDIELGVNQSHSPKHLRTGVNSAMVEHGGLVKLLMDKGVITEVEYYKALCEAMEQEHRRYEELLSKHTGTKMVLV